MAESDHRRGVYTHVSGYDKGWAGAQHKKFLTSRYRDDDRHHGDRRHWGHPGKRHHGGKNDKRHGWKHGYHGHKRHWYKHRHYRDHGTRYRFHYNDVVGAGISGGHISIDLSRR